MKKQYKADKEEPIKIKKDKSRIYVKIIAIFLAVLMVGTTGTTVIFALMNA